MVGSWMMLGVVVGPVFGASIPIVTKLVLRCSTAKPPKAHIHHLTPARDNGVVDNPSSCGVVGLDGAFGLGPTHVDKGLPVGNHLSCCDEKGSQLRFCSRSHDKFDDLGNGENGAVEPWEGYILREKDVGAGPAPGL